MNKIFIGCLMVVIQCISLMAQDNLSALMPMPNKVTSNTSAKAFQVKQSLTYYSNLPKDAYCLSEIQQIFNNRFEKINLIPTQDEKKADIRLIIDKSLKNQEQYVLDINQNNITIKGASTGAVLYGVMTLDQLLLGDVPNTKTSKIASVTIDDTPRFGYRSLMLDPARHFLPVKDVKFYIDQMMRYKYNVLQLHLTDDQGWRVEIKSHPQLTSTGEFYTQEDLKDIVRYAAERNIQVVPELDIPGHTVAVLAVFPELGCTHTDTMSKIVGTTTNMMLCANNPQVYSLYKDVIGEIAAIFPSKYIHLGGDESIIEANWAKCGKCTSLMKELGYTKATELMNYFFGKIIPIVKENDKEPILWCELDNIRMPANEYLFDYPKDMPLITWRYGLTPLCTDLTEKHGNPIIMAPGEYTYFDYPQYKGDLPEFNNWGMPTTTLEKVYEFDPGYGRSPEHQKHIMGVNGTLWGEAIQDINRATYMTYPRGLALAEAGWTEMENRSWDSFKKRMYPNILDMMKRGVSVRVPFEIVPRD